MEKSEDLEKECQSLIRQLQGMELIEIKEDNNTVKQIHFDLRKAINYYNTAGNIPMPINLYYYIKKSFSGIWYKKYLALFVALCHLDPSPWTKEAYLENVMRDYTEIFTYFDLDDPWIDNEEPLIWFRFKKSEYTKYLEM